MNNLSKHCELIGIPKDEFVYYQGLLNNNDILRDEK